MSNFCQANRPNQIGPVRSSRFKRVSTNAPIGSASRGFLGLPAERPNCPDFAGFLFKVGALANHLFLFRLPQLPQLPQLNLKKRREKIARLFVAAVRRARPERAARRRASRARAQRWGQLGHLGEPLSWLRGPTPRPNSARLTWGSWGADSDNWEFYSTTSSFFCFFPRRRRVRPVD